ncbi:MAG: hypothetical protein ABJE10_09530 [bacterium]
MQARTVRNMVVSLWIGSTAVACDASSPDPTQVNDRCHEINAIQTVMADFSNFTTAGVIKSGFLAGTTKFTGDASSLTQLASTTASPVRPISSFTGGLLITTPNGTLTTRSVGLFEPGPFGRGTQLDRVIAGTGQYGGADGSLYFTFEADSTGSAFTSSVVGEVCLK